MVNRLYCEISRFRGDCAMMMTWISQLELKCYYSEDKYCKQFRNFFMLIFKFAEKMAKRNTVTVNVIKNSSRIMKAEFELRNINQ